MSWSSVKAALTPLLLAGAPGITVRDRNQIDRLIPPLNLMPLVMLRERPHEETPTAVDFADRLWWLECMVWGSYQADQDQSSFDTLCEQVAQVLRVNTWLGHEADDTVFGSQLLVSGRRIQYHDYPAFSVGGQTYRHKTIATQVREAYNFVAAVP